MRPNIVSEAGLSTRMSQWWAGIPFITSGVIMVCGAIYLVCLLAGYDTFAEICFLPYEVVSRFQVYRVYTAVLFHGSILHLLFNMLALVPLGTELERIMGSIRLLYLMFLLAMSNGIFHLSIALVVAHNPLHSNDLLMNECAIGFSGILFSMIVIETSLSGVQSRSVFGLFNVPAQWYAWILLILFQLLASNVSLLGHLCGILSGFACLFLQFPWIHVSVVSLLFSFLRYYLVMSSKQACSYDVFHFVPDTYGLFNYLLPGSSFYSAIESSSMISACVRRPGFILCTGGTTYGNLPTHSNTSTASSGLIPGNIWRNLSSWMPQRETITTEQSGPDPRFPGRGRALGSTRNQSAFAADSDLSLQARLLENPAPNSHIGTEELNAGTRMSDAARHLTVDAEGVAAQDQGLDTFDEELKKLVAMGFEKIQAEVALAAADGDPSIAIEILMSQQG